MYNNDIDSIRDLMAIINRNRMSSDLDARAVSDMYSPPYKNTMKEIPLDHRADEAEYPSQLSGMHGDKKQRVTLSGNTNGQA